jgi:hypothetical protein
MKTSLPPDNVAGWIPLCVRTRVGRKMAGGSIGANIFDMIAAAGTADAKYQAAGVASIVLSVNWLPVVDLLRTLDGSLGWRGSRRYAALKLLALRAVCIAEEGCRSQVSTKDPARAILAWDVVTAIFRHLQCKVRDPCLLPGRRQPWPGAPGHEPRLGPNQARPLALRDRSRLAGRPGITPRTLRHAPRAATGRRRWPGCAPGTSWNDPLRACSQILDSLRQPTSRSLASAGTLHRAH